MQKSRSALCFFRVGDMSTSGCNNLMLLAYAASEELVRNQMEEVSETRKSNDPKMYSTKCTRGKQKTSKAQQAEHHLKDNIERSLSSVTMSRGLFAGRMQELQTKILQPLHGWSNLTSEERNSFYGNVRYALTIINRRLPSNQVKLAGTVPFMQLQGASNYCGLCALNNLLGKEVVTIEQMNNIADDLWLRQLEQCEQSLTHTLQCHRDINGFYSFHTIEETLQCFGYSMHLLSATTALRPMLGHKQPSTQSVLHELAMQFEMPIKLLIGERDIAHYTAVHVDNNTIWYFDSKNKTPTSLTAEALVLKLQGNHETTYYLQPRLSEVLIISLTL